MNGTRPLASLVLPFVVLTACGKDGPPADTSPPTKAGSKASAPPPATPAPTTKAVAPPGAPARATTAPDPKAAAATELAAAKRVRTVQVAAYPNATRADWWVSELQRQGIPAYATKATVAGQELVRVRIGAALTGADAHALAEKIHARYQWPTWITMVEDRSALPSDALLATRAYVAKK